MLIRTPFDDLRWQLSNGIRQDMNLAEVKKILGDSLQPMRSQSYYFNSQTTRIELDFAYYPQEGVKDEAYRVHGLYIRQGALEAAAKAPVSASPREARIPEASKPCTAAIATWWQAVRTAANEIVVAIQHKNQVLMAWHQAHRPDLRDGASHEYGMPKKDLDKLDADIATAVEKYRQALLEGQVESYQAPIADSAHPVIIHTGAPRYTEQARKNNLQGAVIMRAEFRSDGTIGEVKISSGLKDGLDEQAIKAIRETIFLPSVKDGRFVTMWQTLQAEFNLR